MVLLLGWRHDEAGGHPGLKKGDPWVGSWSTPVIAKIGDHEELILSVPKKVKGFDPKTGTAPGARWLYVVYIPYATAATTGLSEKPQEGAPWIMFAGTPKAHIMFTPRM